jgi:hypothetical protein
MDDDTTATEPLKNDAEADESVTADTADDRYLSMGK